jgi:ferredoxin
LLEASPTPTVEIADAPPFDLLRVPALGRFLSWRHARTAAQIPLFLLGVLMVLHGLVGPSLAPKNLATTLTWLHFRGVLVLALLAAGNLFCFACPFVFVRDALRRFIPPRLVWPRKLRNKWPSITLLILFLFAYELFDLWSSPWWTAWLIIGYFVAALLIDSTFKHATFCKFVCPIGQFNFAASTLSPLEVKVRSQEVCGDCTTRDCIRGTRSAASDLVVIQRGCELALFQPQKVGNMDCTFCMDCVHACPHDNIGIMTRVPAAELMSLDEQRSGIGHFARRTDISVLALVFTFGALLNAFGMVSPVYVFEAWLSRLLHVNHEAPVLASIFAIFLLIEPLLLLGVAAWVSSKWSEHPRPLVPQVTRYSYGLVPLGFGIWLAHYSFHFLTGMFTVIPVVQSAVADLGRAWLGEPRWTLTGLAVRAVQPAQFGFLMLGVAGSLLVMYRLAEQDGRDRRLWTFAPWALVCILMWAGAVWLMFQPMEMRATFMSS